MEQCSNCESAKIDYVHYSIKGEHHFHYLTNNYLKNNLDGTVSEEILKDIVFKFEQVRKRINGFQVEGVYCFNCAADVLLNIRLMQRFSKDTKCNQCDRAYEHLNKINKGMVKGLDNFVYR